MYNWLLDSMVDNDNFEWINVFSGSIITGEDTTNQQLRNSRVTTCVARAATVSWRKPLIVYDAV